QSDAIDTLLLACTHYPLMIDKIREYIPKNVSVINQGEIVASSLTDYLTRHPKMDARIARNGDRAFLTTDSTESFDQKATIFYGDEIKSNIVHI
ncbi:MAG: glutamate racemase, partial [Marinoscillum sp.]